MSVTALVTVTPAAADGEWSGYVSAEWRLFPQSPSASEQQGNSLSLAAQPEFFQAWNGYDNTFRFVPFVRIDQYDEERTHADIRELEWITAANDWELRLGIRKVFWGVTESQHLVDIINQTDLVENPDGEDKLGQPMINLALIRDWGTLDLFMLTGFRERTFPGQEGRLRTVPRVDTDQAAYESASKWRHMDWALRWSATFGDWDLGVAHFMGTSRDPSFRPASNSQGETVLAPYYELIRQTSIDLQATKGDWLWKLEAITRGGQGDRYTALTAGFEYTLVGVMGSRTDLGLVGEYLFDDRGDDATTPFEDDVFLGLRFTLNDVQNTEMLLGMIADRSSQARLYSFEASRRLGDHWKLSVEARAYDGLTPTDVVYAYRRDDYVQLELARYF